MRNRRRIAVVLVLVFVLVGAACADDDDEQGAGGAGTTTPARQELRVGFTADQYVLEGPDAALGAYPLNANVVETLTYLAPNYEVRPMLAEKWEFRAPNTWRFFLRHDVKFHDGQPLNAQAVKTGLFDRVAKQRGGGTIKAGPASAVVVDDYTIDFTPTASNLRVPEQIVHPNNAVYAPGADPGKNPVGTGPFRFVEYLPKERIVVDRNADYWGNKAKLQRITFRFFPDPSARRLALQAGDIDFAFD
ncbi:MAG TPA: ABC transporter substrate-binding protein, partial [Acidimicrobiales bacterium]|nr:ABC transporter substrate-binding protein [Acidimicrobiales bacterium]